MGCDAGVRRSKFAAAVVQSELRQRRRVTPSGPSGRRPKPQLRSRAKRGVSKDAPGRANEAASWTILRDAMLRIAPQDEAVELRDSAAPQSRSPAVSRRWHSMKSEFDGRCFALAGTSCGRVGLNNNRIVGSWRSRPHPAGRPQQRLGVGLVQLEDTIGRNDKMGAGQCLDMRDAVRRLHPRHLRRRPRPVGTRRPKVDHPRRRRAPPRPCQDLRGRVRPGRRGGKRERR